MWKAHQDEYWKEVEKNRRRPKIIAAVVGGLLALLTLYFTAR